MSSDSKPPSDHFDAANTGNLDYFTQHPLDPSQVEQKHEKYDCTLLYTACRAGKLNIVQYLIETCNADINSINGHAKSTCLHAASYFSHKDVVEYLMTKRPDTTIKNKFDFTAVEEAQRDDVRLIITNAIASYDEEKSSEIEVKSPESGGLSITQQQELAQAIQNDDIDRLIQLISGLPDFSQFVFELNLPPIPIEDAPIHVAGDDISSYQRRSLLGYAAFLGKIQCADFLRKRGCDPGQVDRTGKSPYETAEENGQRGVVFLFDGVDMNQIELKIALEDLKEENRRRMNEKDEEISKLKKENAELNEKLIQLGAENERLMVENEKLNQSGDGRRRFTGDDEGEVSRRRRIQRR